MSVVVPNPDPPGPGDAAEATSRLFHDHSRMVAALCRLLLRDRHEAEDATQQTFLSAHKALVAGTRPREPRAWLATIARNECRIRIRSRMRSATVDVVDDDVPAGYGDATVDAVERNAELAELRAALHDLPPRQRQALLLREVHGLRPYEVAAVMNVAHPTVDVLLWKARRRLGAHLRALPALGGDTGVPPWLREQLARVVPAAGAADAAAAGTVTARCRSRRRSQP